MPDEDDDDASVRGLEELAKRRTRPIGSQERRLTRIADLTGRQRVPSLFLPRFG